MPSFDLSKDMQYSLDMKRCSRCGFEKSEEEFHTRPSTNRLKSLCIPCEREYGKDYYQANKVVFVVRARKSNTKLRAIVRKLKEKPCADCKHEFPFYVMDFDHVSGEKEGEVSRLANVSLKKALAEIKKCDVVCANCHRIRTHNRLTPVAQLERASAS